MPLRPAALSIGLLLSFASVKTAMAEPPTVAASIKPVHGIVSSVMQGVGAPELIFEDSGSPHGKALRPSEASTLNLADLVVWIGPSLEYQVGEIMKDSAPERTLPLLTADGLHTHGFREAGIFDDSGHDDEHGREEGHNDDHGHAHDPNSVDPHIWLHPENAAVMARAVARRLAEIDPENAETYEANAILFEEEVEDITEELTGMLAPVSGRPYVVFHDAYRYFEEYFRLTPVGALSISPDRPPGAARLAELRRAIRDKGVVCLFAEPQFTPRLIETVAEGTDAATSVLDPIGSDIKKGPGHYPQMMRTLARNLSECLSGG